MVAITAVRRIVASLCISYLAGARAATSYPRVWAGNWQACSTSCGSGWKERSLLCQMKPGTIADMSHCFDLQRPAPFTTCRCALKIPPASAGQCRKLNDDSSYISDIQKAKLGHMLEKASRPLGENPVLRLLAGSEGSLKCIHATLRRRHRYTLEVRWWTFKRRSQCH